MKCLSFFWLFAFLFLLAELTACTQDSSPANSSNQSQTTPDGGDGADAIVDQDNDGVPAVNDCDDTSAALGAIAKDADCDGILSADD